MNGDVATAIDDHFHLVAAAPGVFGDGATEDTAVGANFRSFLGTAARDTNRDVDEAAAARIGHLEDDLFGGAALELATEQGVRAIGDAAIAAFLGGDALNARCGFATTAGELGCVERSGCGRDVASSNEQSSHSGDGDNEFHGASGQVGSHH